VRRVLRSGTQQVEILRPHECDPDDKPMEFRNTFSALNFLRRFMYDHFNMMTLRSILAEVLPIMNITSLTDDEILQRFTWQVVHSYFKLVLRVEETPRMIFPITPSEEAASENETEADEVTAEGPVPSTAPNAAAATTAPQVTANWFEFRIVDDETDQPVADVRIRIKLPTGESREHTTDANGVVRIDDVPEGTCDIEEILDPHASEVVQVE